MKDKPFALLSINSDPAERFRKSAKANKITWPNIWDGGTSQGPIASAWGITAWPTVFVIDEKGTIVSDDVWGEGLDPIVEKLIKEID